MIDRRTNKENTEYKLGPTDILVAIISHGVKTRTHLIPSPELLSTNLIQPSEETYLFKET